MDAKPRTPSLFSWGFILVLVLAAAARFSLGDAFTLEGDDHSYYHASRLILEKTNPFAGALELRDIYSFRWVTTWLTALNGGLFGESILSLAFFQWMFSVGLVACTMVLARGVLSPGSTLLAGLFAALTPIGIQFALTLSPDSALAFFTTLSLIAMLKYPKISHLAGSIFVFSYLTKEESAKHLLPLLMLAAIQSGSSGRAGLRASLRNLAMFLFPLIIVGLIEGIVYEYVFGSPWARVQAALENVDMWRRMGTVDPSGDPWSVAFYIRRGLFPAGPFGYLVYPAFIGLAVWPKEGEAGKLRLWFLVQAALLILGAGLGQIQERMLQVLIPALCILAAYGVRRVSERMPRSRVAFAVISVASGLLSGFILIAKHDLRWQASPRAAEVCAEIHRRMAFPVYVSDDIRFHMRRLGYPFGPHDLPDLQALPAKGDSVLAVIRYKSQIPERMTAETLFESAPASNPFARLAAPLRSFRKEYAPYRLVALRPESQAH